MSSQHSDQMSQKSQVSRIAPKGCSPMEVDSRPCCREVKILNRLAGFIFCCVFRYRIRPYFFFRIDHEFRSQFGPEKVARANGKMR